LSQCPASISAALAPQASSTPLSHYEFRQPWWPTENNEAVSVRHHVYLPLGSHSACFLRRTDELTGLACTDPSAALSLSITMVGPLPFYCPLLNSYYFPDASSQLSAAADRALQASARTSWHRTSGASSPTAGPTTLNAATSPNPTYPAAWTGTYLSSFASPLVYSVSATRCSYEARDLEDLVVPSCQNELDQVLGILDGGGSVSTQGRGAASFIPPLLSKSETRCPTASAKPVRRAQLLPHSSMHHPTSSTAPPASAHFTAHSPLPSVTLPRKQPGRLLPPKIAMQ